MLLWIGFIITRQYYGTYKVNKLTFRPLRSAIYGLTANTFYLIAVFYQRCYKQDYKAKLLLISIDVSEILAMILYLQFLMTITWEMSAYWHFIYFQAKVPLEELDVKRFKFQNEEREKSRLNRKRKMVINIPIALLFCVLIAISVFYDDSEKRKQLDFLSAVLMIVMLGLYAFGCSTLIFSAFLYLTGMRQF